MKMKKGIKLFLGFLILCMFTIMMLYIFAFSLGTPDLSEDSYIKMYDNKDEIFYQSINDYNGQYVKLNQVSDDFLHAIVAIEDHRFYSHRGFDPISIIRAIKTNITSGSKSQGASTISQQYARLLYLTNEKSWSRKLKEAFLTMRLETHLSKDEILEGYVNHVYFGHGIYGIENAAHYFYNKSASELNLNESSMLAGIVNGPSYYSPLIDEANAKARQSLVLDRMQEEGYISESQCKITKEQTVNLSSLHQVSNQMSYHYFRDTVKEELEELGFLEERFINKGLNIYTTLDTSYQDALSESLSLHIEDSEVENASVVVEPYTSKILALVGGKDYTTSQFNRATQSKRQIGSTVKPLLYYLALENGFNPTTTFKVEPTTFKLSDGTTYSPTNFNNRYAYKDITLAQAIAVSDNIYAIKTHLFLGENNLYNLLQKFGLEDITPNASLALGTCNTNVFQLANMYNCLASEGVYNEIYTIERIEDHEGNVLYEHSDENRKLLNKESCLILSQLLTSSTNDIFSTYLSATMTGYDIQATVASKTGTSDWDSLACVYNPNLLVVSWSGYDDNRELEKYQERIIPKQVAVDMINFSEQKKKSTWYKPTKKIEEIAIDPLTGQKKDNGIVYWFKKES